MRLTCLALMLLPMGLMAQQNPDYDPDYDLNGCYTMLDILSLLVILMPDDAGFNSPNPSYDPDHDGDGALTITDLTGLLTLFGTCEGEELCVSPTMDGYTYSVVQIGSQCWFSENLRTTVYADGSPIPEVTDSVAWSALFGPGQVVYANDAANEDLLGRLYNGYAVDDPRGICPSGWHVAGDAEWQALETTLGMPAGEVGLFGSYRGIAAGIGTALKSTSGWNDGGNGTDLVGFAGLPAGVRSGEEPGAGGFVGLGDVAFWWTSDGLESGNSAIDRILAAGSAGINRNANGLHFGLSVRCLLDD